MAEQPSRKRRIVGRTVRYSAAVLVLVPLLTAGYVTSYFGLSWALGRGLIGAPTAQGIKRLFAPIDWYRSHHYMGSKWIDQTTVRAYFAGRGDPIPPGMQDYAEDE